MQTIHKSSYSHIVDLDFLHKLPKTLNTSRRELPEDMVVECTTDMQYVEQYYYLRENIYKTDLQVTKFSGEEDEYDRRSFLIIARLGHLCIGGARFTLSTPEAPTPLPIEKDDFSIHDFVPGLDEVNYCELGRTAVLPKYRDSTCLTRMFQYAIEIAHQHNCKYIFGASPPAVARLFQRTFRHLGYRDDIRTDINLPVSPEFEHLNLKFKITHL
jgi:hypothetical protein